MYHFLTFRLTTFLRIRYVGPDLIEEGMEEHLISVKNDFPITGVPKEMDRGERLLYFIEH